MSLSVLESKYRGVTSGKASPAATPHGRWHCSDWSTCERQREQYETGRQGREGPVFLFITESNGPLEGDWNCTQL